MREESGVLLVLLVAVVFGVLLVMERRISGPNVVITVLLVLCGGVAVFCMLLLWVLAAERYSVRPPAAPRWKDDR